MKQKKNQKPIQNNVEPADLENQVMALALNKLINDWFRNRFIYSEGPEKYFEDWVNVNNVAFNPTFENRLFVLFVRFLIMRGNICGR